MFRELLGEKSLHFVSCPRGRAAEHHTLNLGAKRRHEKLEQCVLEGPTKIELVPAVHDLLSGLTTLGPPSRNKIRDAKTPHSIVLPDVSVGLHSPSTGYNSESQWYTINSVL